MKLETIEISANGRWTPVPVLPVNGRALITSGMWLKTASVHDEEWLEDEIADPETYISALGSKAGRRLGGDIFTFTQKLPDTARRYDYHAEWDSIAAIRLVGFKEWWEGLPQETRKNVRRAEKRGITVQVSPFDDELLRGISAVNDDSPTRQGAHNKHYGKSLAEVRRDEESFLDRSDFICAYRDGQMAGFAKIVYRGRIASLLNIASKVSQYDARPSNAVIARAVDLCLKKGILYLTYGQFNYGNKRHSTLKQFKIRNGFEEVLLPRYYVPLTWKGRIAIRLGIHRGLLGILPPELIRRALAARAKWYCVKETIASRCSSMLERPNRNRKMECSTPPAGSNH